MQAAIETHNFWLDTTKIQQQGISLSIAPGSIVNVLGPDQCIVSRWLKSLAGIDLAYSGEISLLGNDVSQLDKKQWQFLRTRIAYLDAASKLVSVYSVMDNIILPALYHKQSARDSLTEQASKIMSELGFGDKQELDQLPAFVGEDCYLAALLVRVILLEPDVLVLDDFFGRSNRRIVELLVDYILAIHKERGMTILVNAPEEDLFMRQADKLLFIMHAMVLNYQGYEDFRLSTNDDVKAFLRKNYMSK